MSDELKFKMCAGIQDYTNNIYPMSELEKFVGKEFIGTFYDHEEMGFSVQDAIEKDKISHVVKNLRVEDNCVIGDVKILNNEHGNMLKQLLHHAKVRLHASGTGRINEESKTVYDFEPTSINVQLNFNAT